MIKFFRKIRQNLLSEGKTGKYLKYAIGEILLVVIGILIALQINSWNQTRLTRIEEKGILKNIKSEFAQNNADLDVAIAANHQSFNTAKKVLNLFGKDEKFVVAQNPDSLIFQTLETSEFIPSDNTISDLVQAGRLQILRNDSLIKQIYKWSRMMDSYRRSLDRRGEKIDKEIVPYLSKNYSMKNVDIYGELAWKTRSNLEQNNLSVFQDIQFENILDDYIYRIHTEGKRLQKLKAIIDRILIETNSDDKIL